MLHIQNVTKQYGSKLLFENASTHLGYRSRVALIGPNGAGKSTLIRIILGEESPDEGQISRAKRLSIGHLAQEVPKFSGRTVLAEVMRTDGRREELLESKKELELSFEKQVTDPDELEHYGRVLEELEHLDEYRLESRAKEIISGMGFKNTDFERSLTEFSGGWLMRVALSRVLLMEPDLLLLDEPTNHLDLESLLWLEEFLGEYRGAMLLVSHDTEFLNRMVNEVLEIDQKKIWSYTGNLTSYALQKEERLKILRSQFAGQQAKIAEVEAFVSRFGAKATKARQAQSKLKQLEKMERIELPEERSSVRFRFPPAPHSGREVITLDNASFAYEDKKIFRNLNWVIKKGSRVAIVGVNGAGKTTLLKLLAGKLAPTNGHLKHGHQVIVGYYAQLQAETLDLKKTILQELQETAPNLPTSQLRGIAGAFLFSGDAVEKKCSVLSGGEKARVALAKLLLCPSNFLLLDEPTNHLDVESRGILLDALGEYDGTLCLVSHDRAFVSPLVDTVLEIIPSPDGSEVHQLVENYEDYLQRKTKEAAQVSKLSKRDIAQQAMGKSQNPISKKSLSNNLKRNLEHEKISLEKEISQLEKKHLTLNEKLADSKTYEDKGLSLSLISQQTELAQNLSQKLSRWEEVCSLLGDA